MSITHISLNLLLSCIDTGNLYLPSQQHCRHFLLCAAILLEMSVFQYRQFCSCLFYIWADITSPQTPLFQRMWGSQLPMIWTLYKYTSYIYIISKKKIYILYLWRYDVSLRQQLYWTMQLNQTRTAIIQQRKLLEWKSVRELEYTVFSQIRKGWFCAR